MSVKETIAYNLKVIRSQTKLNQVKFYDEYLKDVIKISARNGDDPSDYTIQGRMKEYENAERSLPAEALPILSKLSGMSVEEIMGINTTKHPYESIQREQDIETVSDLLSVLFSIEDRISICTTPEKNDLGKEYAIPCVRIENALVQLALMQWAHLQETPMTEPMKKDLIDNWKTGVLEKNTTNHIRSYTTEEGQEVFIPYDYFDLVKNPDNLLDTWS